MSSYSWKVGSWKKDLWRYASWGVNPQDTAPAPPPPPPYEIAGGGTSGIKFTTFDAAGVGSRRNRGLVLYGKKRRS